MIENIKDCPPEKLEGLIKETLERICEQPHGIVFLQILHHMCGFETTSIVLDATGRIDAQQTFNCEARRALYLHLRKFIPREQLALIELPELAETKQPRVMTTTRRKNEDERYDTGTEQLSGKHPALRTTKRRNSARE